MVWFYTETRPISPSPIKFVKHFDLDPKHGKPSNHQRCGWKHIFENWICAGCTSQWKTENWEINIDAFRPVIFFFLFIALYLGLVVGKKACVHKWPIHQTLHFNHSIASIIRFRPVILKVHGGILAEHKVKRSTTVHRSLPKDLRKKKLPCKIHIKEAVNKRESLFGLVMKHGSICQDMWISKTWDFGVWSTICLVL